MYQEPEERHFDEESSHFSEETDSDDSVNIDPANFRECTHRTMHFKPQTHTDDIGESSNWCKHIEASDPVGVRQLLRKSKKCMTCRQKAAFSCIHRDCLKKSDASCCMNVRHIFPHMAKHDHPAIVHYEYRVIICTQCNIRASIREFLRSFAMPTEFCMEEKMAPEPLQLQKGLLGYMNFGNTCYMNAVLQMIQRCSPFTQYLFNFVPPGGWERCPLEIPKTIIQMAIDVRTMYSAIQLPFLSPWRILTCIRNELPGFECFQQQDASEFLRNLLEILDRDLKVCGEYHNNNEDIGMGNPDDDYVIAMNARHTKTVISALFQGVLENQITCHTCGFRSRTFEKFLDLSIPIAAERKRYDREKENLDLINGNDGEDPGFLVHEGVYDKTCLDACLDSFFQNTILEHENQYSCSKCKKLVDATKSTKAKTLPEVILIQLKRFRHSMNGSNKIGKTVEFPLGVQNFGRWTTGGETALYDLAGFVVHEGRSLEFGHYVTVSRHEHDNQWYKFDDITVTKCDATKVAEHQPYILMYRKRVPFGEPNILDQPTQSPFNFFASNRIYSDKDSEAWDVIQHSLEEDFKNGRKDNSAFKLQMRKKIRLLSKQKITDVLKCMDEFSGDAERHYITLQLILEEIVRFNKKNSKRAQTIESRNDSKEAINKLVAELDRWMKFIIKKEWAKDQMMRMQGFSAQKEEPEKKPETTTDSNANEKTDKNADEKSDEKFDENPKRNEEPDEKSNENVEANTENKAEENVDVGPDKTEDHDADENAENTIQ